jgi:hypothetical protein
MSPLQTTKKIRHDLPFKTITEAVRAIQNTTLTDASPVLVTNSLEFQTLVRKLNDLPRPFGIVVVTPKD